MRVPTVHSGNVNITLPTESNRALKLWAVSRGLSVADAIRDLVASCVPAPEHIEDTRVTVKP